MCFFPEKRYPITNMKTTKIYTTVSELCHPLKYVLVRECRLLNENKRLHFQICAVSIHSDSQRGNAFQILLWPGDDYENICVQRYCKCLKGYRVTSNLDSFTQFLTNFLISLLLHRKFLLKLSTNTSSTYQDTFHFLQLVRRNEL